MKPIKPDRFQLDGYEVTWRKDLPLIYNQKDAAFYKIDSNHSWVCTVVGKGFEVDVYCDGDMRADVLVDKNRYETVRTGDELIENGVKNDDDLQKMVDWGMNPWFDLYVHGEHLGESYGRDAVQHEIADAIDSAKMFIDQEAHNAETIENLYDEGVS